MEPQWHCVTSKKYNSTLKTAVTMMSTHTHLCHAGKKNKNRFICLTYGFCGQCVQSGFATGLIEPAAVVGIYRFCPGVV